MHMVCAYVLTTLSLVHEVNAETEVLFCNLTTLALHVVTMGRSFWFVGMTHV